MQQLFPDFDYQITENQLFTESERFLEYLHRQSGNHSVKQPDWQLYATKFMTAVDACIERKELGRFTFKYKPIGAYGFLSLVKRDEDGEDIRMKNGKKVVFPYKEGDFIMQTGCLRYFMEQIMPKEELSKMQSRYIARIKNDSIRDDAAILVQFYMQYYEELLNDTHKTLKDRHSRLCEKFGKSRVKLKAILDRNRIEAETQKTILSQFSRDTAEKTREMELNALIKEWANHLIFEMYPTLVSHGYGYEGRVKVVKGYIKSKTRELEEVAEFLNCRPAELEKAKQRLQDKIVFTI